MAQNEPSHQDLHCLPFCFWSLIEAFMYKNFQYQRWKCIHWKLRGERVKRFTEKLKFWIGWFDHNIRFLDSHVNFNVHKNLKRIQYSLKLPHGCNQKMVYLFQLSGHVFLIMYLYMYYYCQFFTWMMYFYFPIQHLLRKRRALLVTVNFPVFLILLYPTWTVLSRWALL